MKQLSSKQEVKLCLACSVLSLMGRAAGVLGLGGLAISSVSERYMGYVGGLLSGPLRR
jgi:hypothetical protein